MSGQPGDGKEIEGECREADRELLELPERYFALMNEGSQLAKQGAFPEAAGRFAEACREGGRILRRLLEMPKTGRGATEWQTLATLWSFKLVKSTFYWLMARSEAASNSGERKGLLMAAAGAQLVGRGIASALEQADLLLHGKERRLVELVEEALSNFQGRQLLLEHALHEQGINLSALLGEED